MTSRPLTLRDPAGLLFRFESRLLRLIGPEGQENFQFYKDLPVLDAMREHGEVIDYRVLDSDEKVEILGSAEVRNWFDDPQFDRADVELIEYPVIPFASYPVEWSAAMLHDAGLQTLKLAQAVAGDNVR